MSVQWHKLLSRLTIWLALEVILNLMGLDHLADYSEFIFTPPSPRQFVLC